MKQLRGIKARSGIFEKKRAEDNTILRNCLLSQNKASGFQECIGKLFYGVKKNLPEVPAWKEGGGEREGEIYE